MTPKRLEVHRMALIDILREKRFWLFFEDLKKNSFFYFISSAKARIMAGFANLRISLTGEQEYSKMWMVLSKF